MTDSRSLPRQEAFAAELAEEIAAGKHPKGARFPTELELQQRFQVGRHTAREALKILTEQGLLGRRRKTGTIVLALRPVEHYVHSLRNFRGLFDFAQSTRLDIHYEGFVSASVKDQEEFALPDKRWLRIAGVRSKNGDKVPLCWAEVTISERFAPDRESIRQGTKALYELVMAQHGLRLEYVEQKITATHIPPQIAKVLQTEANSSGLLVKRRYVAHTGLAFEISHNLYPADRYSIESVIRQRA
jgi:GntR family transcriptional regulator